MLSQVDHTITETQSTKALIFSILVRLGATKVCKEIQQSIGAKFLQSG